MCVKQILFTVFIFLCAWSWGAAQPVHDFDKNLKQQKEQLQQLKKDIAAKKKETQKLVSKEKDILTSLKQIEQKLDQLSQQIDQLTRDEDELFGHIELKNIDLEYRQTQLGDARQEFFARVRELYKRSVRRDQEWLLAVDSFSMFLKNLKYLNRVAQHNQEEYEDIVSRIYRIRQDKQSLETTLERKTRIRLEKEELSKKMKVDKEKRALLLNEVRTTKSLHESYIKEKEEEYQAIQKIIETLEKDRLVGSKQAPGYSTLFGQSQGSMLWPVKGDVITRFGKAVHPQFNTVTFNKGIDIKTDIGSPVCSVWDGKIILIDWIRGYGKLVIIDHGDGFYTLYAHLAEILVEKGKKVSKGDLIGKSGDTGSIKGPVLHFELRKGKDVLDPLPWLK